MRWIATGLLFPWGDQVKDNIFWSLVSGTAIWSLYESLTLWAYASGIVQTVSWSDAPVYLALMTIGVFFWSTLHFYLNHRLLHWPSLDPG